jgi:DUF4097 and DUF4098 domain-containing protein YvlB
MRTIKIKSAGILLILCSMFLFTNISGKISNTEQERTKSFNVNKGGKLYVNVNPGEIKISAWDKNEVVVKVRGLEEDEIDNVEMELKGNVVSVKYSPQWGWGDDAEFMITIPSQFNVEAKTSGGDVKLNSNITGEVEISSMGGDVSAKDINGSARLSTQGGDVKVGNISGSLNLNTMGGDIRVGDIKGDFAKVSTMGGDINIGKVSSGIGATTYGGDVSIIGIGGTADIQTMGGNIDLRDVKGSVRMETKGGNLSVKNASGSIKATTYAGEIELYGVTGSIDARTMSGNIIAEINPSSGSSNKLFTQNGEVDLYLPPGAKADVEAEIKTWGNWKFMKDTYSIESDFPAKESSSKREKGIEKFYSINGGGAKIKITTTNGNININRGYSSLGEK